MYIIYQYMLPLSLYRRPLLKYTVMINIPALTKISVCKPIVAHGSSLSHTVCYSHYWLV